MIDALEREQLLIAAEEGVEAIFSQFRSAMAVLFAAKLSTGFEQCKEGDRGSFRYAQKVAAHGHEITFVHWIRPIGVAA
jgi:hypothetical protein